MLRRVYALLFVGMLTCLGVHAQVTTSSLTGVVKDATDQALAGATVVAVHQPSGSRYTGVSNAQGQFNIVNMRPGGPYTITVSYVGFEPQTVNDVTLQLAEAFVLNPILDKSTGTLEGVVVTGGRRNNILNANRTGAVTNIGTRELQRLPTISRSLNDFTRLTPQANGQAIGGGNFRQNFITVDGSDFNNTFGIGGNLPAGGSPISLDAIEEISVNIAPYDIRQSNFIGSAINSITRSGTNQFQGSVYAFARNQDMQGNKVDGQSFQVQPREFLQWGARFGGPIIKNKLFFFVNYETETDTRPGQQRFAATPERPFAPVNPNVARPTRTQLDEISDFLRKTYGYETGPYDNYDFVNDQTKMLARIDWNISDKHRLIARYNQVEGKTPIQVSGSTASTGFNFANGFGRTDINALHFSNSNYFQENNFYSAQLELNSRFSNRFANSFRASYNNQLEPRSSPSAVFPFVDILRDGQPLTSFGYEPFTLGNLRDVDIYSFVNNATLTLGKHIVTIGGQYDYSTTRNGFQPLAMSYYRFSSFDSFRLGGRPTDFAQTFSLNPDFSQAFPTFKFAQYSAYAQDEIAFSRKFRLTLGLRADLTTYPDVAELKTNPLVAGLNFAGGEKIDTRELPEPRIMWSPRVGFNYDPYGNRSLQIRGGTGIFTGRVPFVWIVGQSGNSGMLQVTQNFNGVANVPGPFNPNIAAYRPTTAPAAGTVIPSTVTAFDNEFTLPQTWKTSLGFDARLPWGVVGTVDAILNRDINVIYSRNVNLQPQTALGIAGYPDNRLIYPNANTAKFINPLTDARRSGTNPNPSTPVASGDPRGTQQFNAILTGNENRGFAFFLTTKLEKQFSGGLSAQIAYTKAIQNNLYDGNGDQPFNTWSLIQTVNGANNPELSFAQFTVPDRLIAAVSYRKEYLRKLGTTVSLFYEGNIQGRFSYTYTNDFNRDNVNNDLLYVPRDASEITFVDRPASTATGGVALSAAQQSELFFRYLEQDKYLRTRRGQYAERNGAKLPWRNQFDFRVLQDIFTNIGGKRNTLQISLDIFNVGNLLNSSWGITQTTNATSLLEIRNLPGNTNGPGGAALPAVTPGGANRPVFWLATDRNAPVRETFRNNLNLSSTYFMQAGVRYIFNN